MSNMKPVRDYIREQVEAILALSNCMVLTTQPFSNHIHYYLVDWETEILVDHVELNFQSGYFTTKIKTAWWSGHVAGTPEGKVTRRNILPNGLGMLYYDDNRKDIGLLRGYFRYMKKKFITED